MVDGQAQRVFQRQLQQRLVVATHHHQVGAAVHFRALMVAGQLLGTVIAAGQAGDAYLADAVGLHLAQVFFEYQPPQCQVLVIHAGQQWFQFIRRGNDLLPAACAVQYRLDPHGAVHQQQLCGGACIGLAEYAVAAQQGVAGLSGEGIGPARREAGPGR
ncbi:hypothetical protein D9M71_611510 [compost metagenome]